MIRENQWNRRDIKMFPGDKKYEIKNPESRYLTLNSGQLLFLKSKGF